MKDFDSTYVKRTMTWVNENRNIREVQMMEKRKRRKHILWKTAAITTGAIAVLGCMAWFDVGIGARITTVVALTAFSILAIWRDEG